MRIGLRAIESLITMLSSFDDALHPCPSPPAPSTPVRKPTWLTLWSGLTAGRTTVMIAHRLQTLRHCDLQLMLRQGRIVVQVSDCAVEVRSDEFVLY